MGCPLFFMVNNISTTITFLIGHGVRLIGIPVGIYSIYSIRKNNLEYINILFIYLLFSSVISLLDVILCLFEVNSVCKSRIELWLDCSHYRQ